MADRSKEVTLDSMPTVVRECLERKGIINKMKALIRSEIFTCLDDKSSSGASAVPVQPSNPKGIFLANELIKDYLASLQLNNTLSVFIPENNVSTDGRANDNITLDRHFLAEELGINLIESTTSTEVPLLVVLIEYLMKLKHTSKGSGVSLDDSLQVEGFEYSST
jgi:lisH domain-containing protein FOPNL